MDYEKKYKQLHTFINDLYPFMSEYCKEKVEGFLPELKESEDERNRSIKNEVVEMLHYYHSKSPCFIPPKFSLEETLAWLEKQGEQKLTPKFKVGDWIVYEEKCYKVNDNNCGYELIDQNGLKRQLVYGVVDNNAHFWSIEDAKDGDVLVVLPSYSSERIFIFKEINNKFKSTIKPVDYYCKLSKNNFGIKTEFAYIGETNETFAPATREQRELLFSKMKEAGYEWDADKKELKNVEQNTVWSEEDDAYIALISGILNYEHRHGQFTTNGIKFFNNNIIAVEQIQDWLESLKDKVQPKWKPTEEQMNAFYWMKQYPAGEFAKKDILNSLYNDLKKL